MDWPAPRLQMAARGLDQRRQVAVFETPVSGSPLLANQSPVQLLVDGIEGGPVP